MEELGLPVLPLFPLFTAAPIELYIRRLTRHLEMRMEAGGA